MKKIKPIIITLTLTVLLGSIVVAGASGSVAAAEGDASDMSIGFTFSNATQGTSGLPDSILYDGRIPVSNQTGNVINASAVTLANTSDSKYKTNKGQFGRVEILIDPSAVSSDGTTYDVRYNGVDIGSKTLYKDTVETRSTSVTGLDSASNITVEINPERVNTDGFLTFYYGSEQDVQVDITSENASISGPRFGYGYDSEYNKTINKTINITQTSFKNTAGSEDMLYFSPAVESIKLDGQTVYESNTSDDLLGGGGGGGSSNQTLLIGLVVAVAAVLLLTRD